MLKIEDITTIIKLVDQSSLKRFELECENTKLVLSKEELNQPSSKLEPMLAPSEKMANAEVVKSIESNIAQESGLTESETLHTITAPMVGTFYAAVEPGAQPFVQVGQKITSDQIVCILEAMKLFNETEAGINGEIVDVLVKDGDFVEYGQPLFVVKPE
jgi:acetyl-CoA carboxylase biotin carboxyl carrier protein